MSEYAIVLDFKNAKFFPNSNKNFPNNIKVNQNTLWYSHVCNAIHVLLGYRPVPTLRKLTRPLEYGWIPEIVELSRNAVVRLNQPTTESTNTGKEIPIAELFAGTKPNGSDGGSGPCDCGCSKPINLGGVQKTMNTMPLDWGKIKYYIGNAWVDFEKILMKNIDEKYTKFSVYEAFSKLYDYHQDSSFVKGLFGDRYLSMNKSDIETYLREYYKNATEEIGSDLDKFFRKYYLNVPKNGHRIGKVIYEIIAKGDTSTAQNFHINGYGKMSTTFIKFILHSPEYVTSISGKIYLRASEEIVDRLRSHGRATASILESGLLSIESIEDMHTFNWVLNTIGTCKVQTEVE